MRSRDQVTLSAYRLTEKFKLNQTWQREGWEEHQIKRGRIREGLIGVLPKFAKLLQAIYPDQWDVQFEWEIEYKYLKVCQYKPIVFDYITYQQRWARHFDSDEQCENYTIHRHGGMHYNEFEEDVYKKMINESRVYAHTFYIKRMKFTVHFPEVTISNSQKQSLTVKDLFMRFIVKENGRLIDEVYGTRTTYTLAEYATGYVHSHIGTRNFKNYKDSVESKVAFASFCLGNGEIQTFCHFYNGSRSEEDLESYLHMLKTVASWESLEGGPHNAMENVIPKTKDYPIISLPNCQQMFDRLLSRLTYEQCDIDWVFTKGNYHIIDNEKFEDFCTQMYRDIPTEYVVYKDITGQYYVPTNLSQQSIETRPHDYLIFRGNKIHLKVEGELKFAGQSKQYINPKIKLYVKYKLESVCNKSQIRSNTIDRFHQSSNH